MLTAPLPGGARAGSGRRSAEATVEPCQGECRPDAALPERRRRGPGRALARRRARLRRGAPARHLCGHADRPRRDWRRRAPWLQPTTQLDLGSGPGTALWAARETWPTVATTTAIEAEPEMRHARARARRLRARAGGPAGGGARSPVRPRDRCVRPRRARSRVRSHARSRLGGHGRRSRRCRAGHAGGLRACPGRPRPARRVGWDGRRALPPRRRVPAGRARRRVVSLRRPRRPVARPPNGEGRPARPRGREVRVRRR